MAAESSPEKRKIMAPPHINLEEVKNSSNLVLSSPNSPSTLRKASSAKYHCLCSPTTHAGSFRCRYHRNPGGLPRSSMSVGSKLSELVSSVRSDLSEMGNKGSRMCDQIHAQ